MDWFWPLLLLALGLTLTVMEVFCPSAGIIAFLAACSIIASIVMAFRHGTGAGLSVLASAMVAVPVAVLIAFYYWPKTPMGKRMRLGVPDAADVSPDTPKTKYLKGLIGRTGYAKSTMLPSGAVVMDGRTIDAVSEGMPIEVGQRVRVIEVRANRVVVRPIDENDDTPLADSSDPLAQPFEEV